MTDTFTSGLNKEGFRQIIVGMLGLLDSSVTWAKDDQNFVSDVDAISVTLSLISYVSLGIDEYDYTLTGSGNTGQYSTLLIGQREIVIQVKAESYDAGAESLVLIDQLQTKMYDPTFNEQMTAIGLSFQKSGNMRDLPTTYNERVVNVASIDLTLNGLAKFSHDFPQGTGWVDEVVAPVGTVLP